MSHKRAWFVHIVILTGVLAFAGSVQSDAAWPRMVESANGVSISYEVHGTGEPTLVFIHGWSCDARYWRAQVPRFSANHRVVTIDLAGHGHSALDRDTYTMAAFGADVAAVVEQAGGEQVVLIGHSMGGPVSVHAAKRMPERVTGIVGVDTFHEVAQELSQEEYDSWMAPLREDFRHGAREFVPQMFIEETDSELRDWVVADMSSAAPEVAVSAMEQMLMDTRSGQALAVFENLEVPVVAINADLWPTNVEGNREHLDSFDAVILEGTDHFLHMAVPETFNRELEKVIAELSD